MADLEPTKEDRLIKKWLEQGIAKEQICRWTGRTAWSIKQKERLFFRGQKNIWDHLPKRTAPGGYMQVYMPHYPRAEKSGWVFEHILVIEKKLRRPLRPGEVTHHLNRRRDDNRPENLAVEMRANHSSLHIRRRWRQWEIGRGPFPGNAGGRMPRCGRQTSGDGPSVGLRDAY